ncbi:AMP-binding protein [Caballeronia sp. LP003]|uniref:AMP-binding protein n=1 Tax=Caballeronia sp. LP003 TaxID=3038551 RepID=UPI00285B4679|nr:AMP-binding protein [Caballeronia sp. LP003]MDR5785526.1 AMP-binding protein [Caballeronia sp. LP003]
MNRHDLNDLGGGSVSGLLAARARQAPDNLALSFEETEYTYRDLDEAVNVAGAALTSLGFEDGDAVAIFMENRPEWIQAALGIARAKMVQVPINTAYKGEFLHYALEHAEVRVLVTESRLASAVMSLEKFPASLQTIVVVDGVPDDLRIDGPKLVSWDELLTCGTSVEEHQEPKPQDAACITFTSGTTGRSKGVVCPHLFFAVMARETAQAFELETNDRLYTCMPLFHGMASITTVAAAIYAGATIILSRRFSVSRFWDEVRQSRATQFNALGSMLHMLMSRPPAASDRAHTVTRIFSAPAPADVLYRFERRYGVHVIEGYGQTEIKNVLYNPRRGRKIGSLGKPTPSSILEIHDEQGNPLPAGAVGEIVYRPRIANIMLKEYFRNPQATLDAMRDLWWHTGDFGSRDEDGFFYFHDRKSDSLRKRGENISSRELEAVVNAFPGVKEAAAVAAYSEVGEDDVLVVCEVESMGTFDFEALYRYCAEKLPRFMVPRYFRALETLPRTPTGKVRKAELRAEGLPTGTWDAIAGGNSVPR